MLAVYYVLLYRRGVQIGQRKFRLKFDDEQERQELDMESKGIPASLDEMIYDYASATYRAFRGSEVDTIERESYCAIFTRGPPVHVCNEY